jgi:hypothetical protein
MLEEVCLDLYINSHHKDVTSRFPSRESLQGDQTRGPIKGVIFKGSV